MTFKIGDIVTPNGIKAIGCKNISDIVSRGRVKLFLVKKIISDRTTMTIEYNNKLYIVFIDAFKLSLSLDIGKQYKTRDGLGVWTALYRDKDNKGLIVCRTNKGQYVSRWPDGRLYTDRESPKDLVEEVKPERWVGLHYFGNNQIGITSGLNPENPIHFNSESEVKDYYSKRDLRFIKAVRVE